MPLTFNEYQNQAKTTLTVKEDKQIIPYLTLGLVGEAGEIAEKVKKILRNHDGDFSKLDREDIKRELGDVQWYLSVLSEVLGFAHEDVAQTNLDKLADRKKRDTINSTGDYR